jgi:hypothetical protein
MPTVFLLENPAAAIVLRLSWPSPFVSSSTAPESLLLSVAATEGEGGCWAAGIHGNVRAWGTVDELPIPCFLSCHGACCEPDQLVAGPLAEKEGISNTARGDDGGSAGQFGMLDPTEDAVVYPRSTLFRQMGLPGLFVVVGIVWKQTRQDVCIA